MADEDHQDPETAPADDTPRNPYRIIENSNLRDPFKSIADPAMHYPFVVPADTNRQGPSEEPQLPPPSPFAGWIQRLRTFTATPTRAYVSLGIGLGILAGVIIAALSWHISNPEGPYDLGTVASTAVGLKGHLFTKWDKRLEYRLALEPGTPKQQAGFAFAVANSPRPLSVGIQLNDGKGFVVCSWEIALKYEARNAAFPTADALTAKTDAASLSTEQMAQDLDFARQDADELQREQGKDIFQNEIVPDGKIAATNAQGEAPCSKKAYENTSYWSFSPNFPSLAEQEQLLKRREEAQANAGRLSSATRKRLTAKIAARPLILTIKGDDAIVEYDASRGVIETSAGKIFLFDKSSADGNDSRWQDYPVSVHYKCDQNSSCTLKHAGIDALRVRLRK